MCKFVYLNILLLCAHTNRKAFYVRLFYIKNLLTFCLKVEATTALLLSFKFSFLVGKNLCENACEKINPEKDTK